ncbi:MAG: hypothetical protein WCY06_06945 [Flavobacteriaceae bacterium]
MISTLFERLKEANAEISDIYYSGFNWIFEASKIIKKTITQVGRERGYFVCTHSVEEADSGEWLFDISFHELEYEGAFTKTLCTPLVVESEFSKTDFGGFKEDFDKLLIATSSERLFILRVTNQSVFDTIKKYAQDSVNKYKPFKTGERVHIIYWDETVPKKDFYYLEIKKQEFVS